MAISWAVVALAGIGALLWFGAESVASYRKRRAFDKYSGWPTPENVPMGRVIKVDKKYWDSNNGTWRD